MSHAYAVAGKVGRIKIDGTYFNLTEWSITPSADYLNDRGYEDQGDSGIIGVEGAEISFGGPFRPTQNQFDKSLTLTAASGIRPGAYLPLELQLITGFKFVVTVLITSTPVDSKVRGVPGFKASGRVQGLIEFPGDTVGDTVGGG